MTARAVEHPNYMDAATLNQVAFCNPLPGTGAVSDAGKSLVRETDADIRAGRLESALDACLVLNAIEPDYVPGFIRTTELLVATDRQDHARRLLNTIVLREELTEREDFSPELAKIRIHLKPDVDTLAGYAYQLIAENSKRQTVPYVPAAVEQLAQSGRLDDSAGLAALWVEKEPSSPIALSCLVRAHLRAGDGASALKAMRQFRDEFDADRIWPENIAVSALAAIASGDIEPKWMAAGPVCKGLRERKLNYEHVASVLEFLVPAIESPQRALLFAGILAGNAGDFEEARALFQTTPAESPVESYLRNVGLERAAEVEDDQRARFTALKEIWQILDDPQVAAIAESSEVFHPPASITSIGIAIARILQGDEAYTEALQFLDELTRRGDENVDVLRLKAEIMGQSGSRNDALSTLESLLRRQEEAHKYGDAVDTLDAMIRLVPGNVRLRSRIVDNCLKVGRFEQAIDQLVMQGRLYHKAGRLSDAEPPIHRAIEIATMTSDWEKMSKLHRLLISFAPDETRLRHSAVATYVQHGHTSEAIDQLREIVRIARKHNDMDEAIAASHQMLALDPHDPATYHQLGELLVSIQEYNQADRVYRRLADLVPDDHAVKAKRSAIAALTRARQPSSNRQ